MAVTINAAGPFMESGDSITCILNYAWAHAAGGLIDQINAKFVTPAPAPNLASSSGASAVLVSGSAGVVVNSTPVTKTLNWQTSNLLTAQSGWRSQDVLANLPTALATYKPKVILMLIGINDILLGPGESTYESNMNAIFDAIHAADSTTQVILLSVMAHFEQWDNVTGWSPGPNTDDAAIATMNAFLAGIPAVRPYVTYVDVRSQLLAAEKIANTSPVVGSVVGVQSGVYTDSAAPAGIHPLSNLKLLMASTVMSQITVTP